MFPCTPVTALADYTTVVTASSQFTTIVAMAPGQYYVFVSSTNCFIKQGSNPTASVAALSLFVPANVPLVLNGNDGIKLAVIRQTADGVASLCPLRI